MCRPPVKQFENTQSTSEEVADLCRLKTNTAEKELKKNVIETEILAKTCDT